MAYSHLASFVLTGGLVTVLAASCGGNTSNNTDGGGADGSTDVATNADTNTKNDAAAGNDAAGPPCTSDANCAQPTPYCNTQLDVCVECLGDANCGMGRTCDMTTFMCVQCTSDAQCGGQTPYCSPADNCVQCLTAANCNTNDTCDTTNYVCVPKCTMNNQCHAPDAVCNTTGGYCVQCLQTSDCMGGTVEGEVCNTTDDRCVECLQNSDCKNANRPICNTAHDFCVQCVTNADCGDAGQTCSALGVCQ